MKETRGEQFVFLSSTWLQVTDGCISRNLCNLKIADDETRRPDEQLCTDNESLSFQQVLVIFKQRRPSGISWPQTCTDN